MLLTILQNLIIITLVTISSAEACHQERDEPAENLLDENADFLGEIQNGTVLEQIVHFYCVRPGSEEFVQLFHSDNVSTLAENFDLSLPLGFVIHGWTDSIFKDPKWMLNGKGWVQTLLIDWAKYGNITACGVDWYAIANVNYTVAALVNTNRAAEIVTQFILKLVKAGVKTEKITIAGHSLGAHVAGFTGKLLIAQGHQLSKIYGLDPAGPLFTFPFIVAPPEKRLARTDATFVQVIHTAAKTLGTQICMGDADFWANGGEMQPGCLDLNPIVALSTRPFFCSHYRAVEFFWYALNPLNQFVGHNCKNGCDLDIFHDVLPGSCSVSQTDRFGIYTDSKDGCFKLTTTDIDHCALP